MTGIREEIIEGTERLIGDILDDMRVMALGHGGRSFTDREANELFTRLVRLSRFRRDFSTDSPDVDARTLLDVVQVLTKS